MKSSDRSKIKDAVRELKIDKPIMSYKVVGSRVELHLLGGSVEVLDSRPFYRDMSLPELKRLARRHKIPGRSKMNRQQLIESLEAID